ncbi:MAG: T9SS type A sorting domain-containing protein [Chitinophagaceae bacterium]|nr:T9SS type A sorting domain-containing protein [Chitinophagaceae bacterium]
MPKPIQLHIPTPCHEKWEKMLPTEDGRHCAVCEKTVVDLTGMSDMEIIRYMTRAGSNVCGRLLPSQINRRLVPMSPVQRNGGKRWQLLLAGLMLTADGSMPHHTDLKGAIHLQLSTPPKTDRTEGVLLGAVMPQIELDTTVKVVEVETPGTLMGDISVQIEDTIPGVEAPPVDTMDLQKKNISCMPADSPENVFTGEITIRQSSPVDTIKQFVKDTLTALRILPKQELHIYPNPVRRESALHLAWQSEPGTYKVNLLSVTGALILARVVEVGSSSQVDTWEMPGGLAAGVYIIQVTRPGQPGGLAQKVIVE